MDKKTKKSLLILGGIVLVLLVFLSFLLSKSFNDGQDSSIFSGGQQELPPATEEERVEEYESREEFPEDIAANLNPTVMRLLSAGEFEALDEQLQEWENTYRNVNDQSSDVAGEIDAYRSDIAFYSNLSVQEVEEWHFRTPEVLAAAIAFAPVSDKYQAFIFRNSALFPPARDDILLHEADLTNSELKHILDGINAQRTEAGQFTQAAVYDMSLFGYDCRFVAVTDSTTFLWQPYSLEVLNDKEFNITAAVADEIIEGNPEANLDEMFAAPTQNASA